MHRYRVEWVCWVRFGCRPYEHTHTHTQTRRRQRIRTKSPRASNAFARKASRQIEQARIGDRRSTVKTCTLVVGVVVLAELCLLCCVPTIVVGVTVSRSIAASWRDAAEEAIESDVATYFAPLGAKIPIRASFFRFFFSFDSSFATFSSSQISPAIVFKRCFNWISEI